jgi:hypothetical protein
MPSSLASIPVSCTKQENEDSSRSGNSNEMRARNSDRKHIISFCLGWKRLPDAILHITYCAGHSLVPIDLSFLCSGGRGRTIGSSSSQRLSSAIAVSNWTSFPSNDVRGLLSTSTSGFTPSCSIPPPQPNLSLYTPISGAWKRMKSKQRVSTEKNLSGKTSMRGEKETYGSNTAINQSIVR